MDGVSQHRHCPAVAARRRSRQGVPSRCWLPLRDPKFQQLLRSQKGSDSRSRLLEQLAKRPELLETAGSDVLVSLLSHTVLGFGTFSAESVEVVTEVAMRLARGIQQGSFGGDVCGRSAYAASAMAATVADHFRSGRIRPDLASQLSDAARHLVGAVARRCKENPVLVQELSAINCGAVLFASATAGAADGELVDQLLERLLDAECLTGSCSVTVLLVVRAGTILGSEVCGDRLALAVRRMLQQHGQWGRGGEVLSDLLWALATQENSVPPPRTFMLAAIEVLRDTFELKLRQPGRRQWAASAVDARRAAVALAMLAGGYDTRALQPLLLETASVTARKDPTAIDRTEEYISVLVAVACMCNRSGMHKDVPKWAEAVLNRVSPDSLSPEGVAQLCPALVSLGLSGANEVAARIVRAAVAAAPGIQDPQQLVSIYWSLVTLEGQGHAADAVATMIGDVFAELDEASLSVLDSALLVVRGNIPDAIHKGIIQMDAANTSPKIRVAVVRLCRLIRDGAEAAAPLQPFIEQDIESLSATSAAEAWHALAVLHRLPASDPSTLTRWRRHLLPTLMGLSADHSARVLQAVHVEHQHLTSLGESRHRHCLDGLEALAAEICSVLSEFGVDDLAAQQAGSVGSALRYLGIEGEIVDLVRERTDDAFAVH
eukprot:TRINITY_DN16957_c0_g1_i2.p1 TRINITY_DN16957_c0_g1~~TRINITY_DN16957_c0_g1_i2.p1  ORF type:complete len:661 (+),score=134.07 TRINITY_DN16957_c0_g1_i2:222-2204(+)